LILIVIVLFLIMLVLLPLLFADLMAAALVKLHLDPSTAIILVVAIMFGSLINIPVKRITRTETVIVHPLAIFGLWGVLPQLRQLRRETIIAVNVGGCIIPLALAFYEMAQLARQAGMPALLALAVAVGVNIAVCFAVAKPVPEIGITMPAFVPAIVAAASASLLLPNLAPPIAFVAGAMGPIVGADLLHIRQFTRVNTGVASIGGAGTFDGIVFSCIVAAYLA
jgi:uncharacterized membrane protein